MVLRRSLVSLRRGLPLAAALVVAALVSGCATGPSGKGRSNLAGIISASSGGYQPPRPTTLALSTEEIRPTDSPSGREVKLLWGLITITDY